MFNPLSMGTLNFFFFILIDQLKTYFLRYLKKNFFLVEWFNKIGGIINTILNVTS